MTNIFLIVALLVLFFFVIQKYVIKHETLKDFPYKKRRMVFTSPEMAFYRALVEAVGIHGVILSKVNMNQVVTIGDIKSKKDSFIALSRISKSYFDFVICDPRTLEPRAIVEFDDGKELNRGKVEREKLLLHVCKSASIPLIGANVKYSYQVSKLRRLLATHIDLIESDREVRFCKRCGSPMNIKLASQGDFKGRRFFTCSRQPHCNYTENYNVVFGIDDDEENG
jgi:ssDNA-binding Zn-finger/Zn-ribbon topoisomerase 1